MKKNYLYFVKAEDKRNRALEDSIKKSTILIDDTEENIEKLEKRRANIEKKLNRLRDLRDNYENAPTTDDSIALKLEELKREKQQKVRERKANLKRLSRNFQRSKSSLHKDSEQRQPRLMRGKTFNLEFSLVPKF